MSAIDEAPLGVGYVMTHYPRLAQTFIAGEIDAVEAAGVAVQPFAMNRPDARERAAPGAAERERRTTYLKERPLAALADAASVFARHPLGMAAIVRVAAASGGGGVRRTVRRLAHLVQAARLARSARARGVTHLHAHFGLAPATIAWLASRIMALDGRPVGFSFTIHGFHDFADPAETRLDLKARAAAAVVCVSDFTRSQLCLTTPAALWSRFHVVRCGVDLHRWRFAPRMHEPSPVTVVAIGRLSAEKGFSVLIESMALLRDRGVDARLTLVGDGPERRALADAIATHGLTGRVDLVGELPPERVRECLQRADIFCLPSFSEGLPVSIMEAMAAGVPTVATWIAGIPELAQDGVTALTVPPARADALADALGRLIADPALGARLAAAARTCVEARHDQAANGQAIATLLRAVAA